jgi:hypothetical protein
VQAQTKEYWRELCERAVNEEDPEKFLAIIREINTVLALKSERFKQTRCRLCDKPLALEACKTDESGQAVHEECYLLKIRLRETA